MAPSTRKSKVSDTDGKVALQQLIVEIFGQPKDGILAKALERARITEIQDVLILSKSDREALSYIGDTGATNNLPIGYHNMLKVAKIYASFCKAKGDHITNWTKSPRLILMTSSAVMVVIGPLSSTPSPHCHQHPCLKQDPMSGFKLGIK